MERREFTQKLLAQVSSLALMESLFASNAIQSSVKPILTHWAIELQTYCADLKKDTLKPIEWQSKIDSLYQRIELEELLKFIDFQNLVKGFEYPDLGVKTKSVRFPSIAGLPDKTIFIKKIFGMKKDRAIIPHGHSNMASAHFVLKGNMHLRHYEKLRQEGQQLVIKPTLDTILTPGNYSSISDQKDNVHWFIANSESAFTFDVIVLDLNHTSFDIHNLDIYEKQDLPDGSMRVPILDVQTALKKYGKETHH